MAHDPPSEPAQWHYPPHQPWNAFAIASLVVSLAFWGIGSILGAIFGHIALRQIAERGEQGKGLAIAGLVIGYVGLVMLVASILFIVAWFNMTDFPFADWPEPADHRP